MAVFNEPSKWAQTLGKDADVVVITNTAPDNDPSIDKIFPSIFSIPLAQGGRAVPRSVLNGFFKLLGDWCFYQQNGGVASYSTSYDYAVGSVVKYNKELYRCIQANGVSTTLKAPTDSAYWSKITTLADVADAFANQDLSNLSASGQAILDGKADISLSNVNDTANILMAHNAMPSTVYDNLTLGTTGTEYTAPADGYVFIRKSSTSTNQYLGVTGSKMALITNSGGNVQALSVFLPIKKGEKYIVTYTASGDTGFFRFIYAVGSESEKV